MKRTLAGCIVAVVGVSAWAGGIGTTGAPVLRIGVSARAASMGDAFSVVSDGASLHYNPATGGLLERVAVNATYIKWFEDLSYSHVGYTQPIPSGALGASVGLFSVGPVKRTAASPVPVGEFSPSTVLGSVMYAYRAGNRLSLGASLKYLSDTLDTVTGTALAADLGAVFRPVPGLTLGIATQNLGSGISYGGAEAEPLPLAVRGGVGYTTGGFTGVLDLVSPADGSMVVHIGSEYVIAGVVGLRAGYRLDTGANDLGGLAGVCAGVGIKAGWFGLDYAFVSYGDLDSTHWVTLSYRGIPEAAGQSPSQPASVSPKPVATTEPAAVPPSQPAVRRIAPIQKSTAPAGSPQRPAAPVRVPAVSSGTVPSSQPQQPVIPQEQPVPAVAPAVPKSGTESGGTTGSQTPAEAETPSPAVATPNEGSPQ